MTLAIVMELCRYGSLFRVLDYARRVARLPPDVRSGRSPPRTPEEAKLKVRLPRPRPQPCTLLLASACRSPALVLISKMATLAVVVLP